MRAGRSGGSKAGAENPPKRWPSLPHPVHSVPAASLVSSVKLGLLEGLLHSGPAGWVASSPAFGFLPFLPHLLRGVSGTEDTPGTTECIACLSPPPETSRDVRGNPGRTPRSEPRGLQVYNLTVAHVWPFLVVMRRGPGWVPTAPDPFPPAFQVSSTLCLLFLWSTDPHFPEGPQAPPALAAAEWLMGRVTLANSKS